MAGWSLIESAGLPVAAYLVACGVPELAQSI
jgi:hypothetical protein